MITGRLPKQKKPWLLFAALLLMLLFRWHHLTTSIWVNAGAVAINHYPAWRSIVERPLPGAPPPRVTLLQQATQISPENTSLWRGLGLFLFATGQEEEAVAVWQNAGLDPAQVAASQGYYANSVGRYDISLAWYAYAVQLDPGLAQPWRELGRLRLHTGQAEAARVAYERAFDLGDADSAEPLARLWRDDGEPHSAIAVWQAALHLFPDHGDRLRWWQGLSNVLRATGQWEAGQQVVEQAVLEFPEDARLYVEYGAIIYGYSGNADAAMNALHRAMLLNETMTGAYSTAAQIMASERRYEEAYQWYSEVIERDPLNPSWYVAQGNMARAAGDLSLARHAFEEAIAQNPDFAAAYYGIALIYQQLDDKDAATSAITRALQLSDNQNLPYLLRAGEIYEWSGNFTAAVEVYRRVVDIEPDNAVATAALQRLLTQ
jgi:tetratricopeptide (TPR) repeat protein